jgi:hypothetical protein
MVLVRTNTEWRAIKGGYDIDSIPRTEQTRASNYGYRTSTVADQVAAGIPKVYRA